jgi:hypothetical protein
MSATKRAGHCFRPVGLGLVLHGREAIGSRGAQTPPMTPHAAFGHGGVGGARRISAAGGRSREEKSRSQNPLTVYYLLCRRLPVVGIGIIPEVLAIATFAAEHRVDLIVGIDIARRTIGIHAA